MNPRVESRCVPIQRQCVLLYPSRSVVERSAWWGIEGYRCYLLSIIYSFQLTILRQIRNRQWCILTHTHWFAFSPQGPNERYYMLVMFKIHRKRSAVSVQSQNKVLGRKGIRFLDLNPGNAAVLHVFFYKERYSMSISFIDVSPPLLVTKLRQRKEKIDRILLLLLLWRNYHEDRILRCCEMIRREIFQQVQD